MLVASQFHDRLLDAPPFAMAAQILLPATDLKMPRLMAEGLRQWEALREGCRPGEAA
jgi:hypothetical protein